MLEQSHCLCGSWSRAAMKITQGYTTVRVHGFASHGFGGAHLMRLPDGRLCWCTRLPRSRRYGCMHRLGLLRLLRAAVWACRRRKSRCCVRGGRHQGAGRQAGLFRRSRRSARMLYCAGERVVRGHSIGKNVAAIAAAAGSWQLILLQSAAILEAGAIAKVLRLLKVCNCGLVSRANCDVLFLLWRVIV